MPTETHVCYLCGSESHHKRNGRVRDNPELDILECEQCGLVFLAGSSCINESFYKESGMHGEAPVDVTRWLKETAQDDQRRFQFLEPRLVGSSVLDFGCGAGGFLMKAQDLAEKTTGVELESRLSHHYIENRLMVYGRLEDLPAEESYDLITAFHVVEHLPDPRRVLRQLARHLLPDGEMIIEVPSSEDALLTLYKNRPFSEFTYWSCHLFLFSPTTLVQLANQSGLDVRFVKQVQRYPLSNHLYWLATGKPGGHTKWSFLDAQELNEAYEAALAKIGVCDTLVAGLSLQ